MEKTENDIRPFGMKDKISYMMGDIGCNLSFALNSYLLLFYTQYIGLGLGTWGIIILVLKVWDAINDPLIGILMDHLKPGKRGKFKTYIWYGSIMLTVSGAMAFLPIKNAPYLVKVVVAMAGYMVWDMAYTIVNVPYGAMTSAITTDPVERAELSTFRTLGGTIGTLIVMLALPMFLFDGNNELQGDKMFLFAIILGIFAFIAFQILLRGTVERVQVVHTTDEKPKFDYLASIGRFLKSKPAIGVTLASFFQLLASSGITSANQILFQSFFKNAKISGVVSLLGLTATFVLMPAVKPLVAKFGKRNAACGGLALSLLGTGLMIVLPVPPNGTGIAIWAVLTLINSAGSAIFNMVSWAMVADAVDYQHYKTGVREEGTVYAFYSFGRKLAQGIGASLIAFLLIFTGYDATLGASQTAQTAGNVKLLVATVMFVSVALQITFLMFMYTLDKKEMEKIQKELHLGVE